jgi:hypothetical protein
MAGIPLNTFLTRTKIVRQPNGFVFGYPNPAAPDANNYLVYTAAPGTSGVILYAQCVNISSTTTHKISAWLFRPNDTESLNRWTEILIDTPIATNDALVLLGGKLVLESGDSFWVAGTAPNIPPTNVNTDLKLTLSILESANQ